MVQEQELREANNNNKELTTFAELIRKYCVPAQLSLSKLARLAGISRSTLYALFDEESDERKLTDGQRDIKLVREVVRVLAENYVFSSPEELNFILQRAYPTIKLSSLGYAEAEWYKNLLQYITNSNATSTSESKNRKNKTTGDIGIGSKANLAPLPARSANGLVGREAEAEQLIEMLTHPDSKVRLVTLKGMGGIGKTSLGLEVLHRLAEQNKVNSVFPGGIAFVPLAEATSTGLLIAAMLQAVGMKPAASGSEVSPMEQLTNFLATKHMLIMLDNFEQLLAVNTGSGELEENPRRFLSNLLTLAPGLKLLVTSQARLRIQGEQVFEVGLLGYPALGAAVSEDTAIQQYPAVKLFVEAANRENNNQVNDAFTLTAENVRDVCTICYYLDGIPLAISLAAGRANEFKPDVMLAAFLARGAAIGDANFTSNRHSSMKLLAQGAGYLPKRHQKIESTLDWSYEWLTEKERAVFRRLAVFEGGFGLEAVASVCTGVVGKWEVGEIISSLVGKSLVAPVSSGSEVRYKLLVTMQDYGLLQLEKTGELEEVREQHAGWGLGLVREAKPHLSAASRVQWQERLKVEHANLSAALGWLVGKGKAGEATEMAAVLGNFAVSIGSNYRNEAKLWLQKVLSMNVGIKVVQNKKGKDRTKPEIKAEALHQAGRIAVSEKSWAVARNYFEQAISLWRETNNLQGLSLSLIGLGNIVYFQLNNITALAYYTEAEKLARQTGDNYALVAVLGSLANIALATQDYKNAQNRYREVIRLKNLAGDLPGMATSMKNLATALIKERKFEEARQFSKESLELNNNLARQAENVGNFYNLGEIEQHQNNLEKAKSYYLQSLKLAIETTNFYYIPVTLNKFVTILLLHQKELFAIAKIYGAIEKIIENSPDKFDSTDRLEYNAGVDLLERQLDKNIIQIHWLEGRDIGHDLKQVALYAFSIFDAYKSHF